METNQIATKGDIENAVKILQEEIRLLREGNGTMSKWLRGKQVQELLGISASTLQCLRIKGLPYSKVEGICFYKSEDLLAFMEEHRIENKHEK